MEEFEQAIEFKLKFELTLSYHMWQSQCVESNDLEGFKEI
jgi:hypothetical protein